MTSAYADITYAPTKELAGFDQVDAAAAAANERMNAMEERGEMRGL